MNHIHPYGGKQGIVSFCCYAGMRTCGVGGRWSGGRFGGVGRVQRMWLYHCYHSDGDVRVGALETDKRRVGYGSSSSELSEEGVSSPAGHSSEQATSNDSVHFNLEAVRLGQQKKATVGVDDNEGSGGNAFGEGTVFGACALIIGSTIGAGILALPEITADAGFVPSSVGLVAIWTFLVAQALLLAEVNIQLMSTKQDDTILTLRAMAEETLGYGGKMVTWIYMGLSYCLLVAYLTKVAGIFSFAQSDMVIGVFVLCTISLFSIGGPSAPDKLNQGLTSVLIGLFLSILVLGFASSDTSSLIGSIGDVHWVSLGPAVPIMFLSLVYHDLIPLICSYLNGDRKKIQTALVFGSMVPLAMFIAWEAIALSFMPGEGGAHADPVQILIQHGESPILSYLVRGFSFAAIFTSFLGTVMGVSETIRAEIPQTRWDRDIALALTLLPPLAFTSGDPAVFLSVLSIAGGYGMTFLYGILPPLMAASARASSDKHEERLLPGGNPILAALLFTAVGLGAMKAMS